MKVTVGKVGSAVLKKELYVQDVEVNGEFNSEPPHG